MAHGFSRRPAQRPGFPAPPSLLRGVAFVLNGLVAGCGGGDTDPAAPGGNQVTCPPGWNTAAFFRTVTPEQVVACIEAGESVLTKSDGTGETPLHLAGSFSDDPAVIRTLIDAGARPDARNNDDDTVLCVAVERNENSSVIQALLDGGSRPNEVCRWGYAPLHMAARFNANADVSDALIRAGADVNWRPPPTYDESGNWIGQHGTPIQIAAFYQDNPAVVDVLVRAGADLRDSLSRAARYNEGPGVLEIVSILIAAGADLSGALHSSVFNAVTEVTGSLISAGADLNEGVVMELIRGEPIEGATPLHFAAAAGGFNLAAVEVLLEADADPNIQDSTGRTPLDWAESGNRANLAELLRRYGGQSGG